MLLQLGFGGLARQAEIDYACESVTFGLFELYGLQLEFLNFISLTFSTVSWNFGLFIKSSTVT